MLEIYYEFIYIFYIIIVNSIFGARFITSLILIKQTNTVKKLTSYKESLKAVHLYYNIYVSIYGLCFLLKKRLIIEHY